MSDDTIIFYHAAPSRGAIVRWMLEEVGAPYRVELLDLTRNEQKSPGYLAVNPMGKVPAIVHRGVPVTEVVAICCYLADAFQAAGLAPAIGDPLRGPYLRWSVFEASALEPAIIDRMLQRPPGKPGALGYGDFDTTMDVVAQAVAAGPWLLGERFSTADVLVGSALRWGGMVDVVPERAEFTAYLARLNERPALQRAMAQDQELASRPSPV
ncbi:MAG: glutathione S-transferase family protein [Geminicoccaceae bacterium]